MKKLKYTLDIQKFATFTPKNVLLSDAMTGTIPAEQGTLIIKDFMEGSTVMQLAKQENMTKLEKDFTYLANGIGAYWVGEGEKIQTSKPTWLNAKLVAKKIAVIIPVSKEFLNYTAPQAFEELRPEIAKAFYAKFDSAALFGTDTPYAVGQSVWERVTDSGNTIEAGTTANLYTDLNAVLATVEDGDNDANGFVTTRGLKKDLRGAVDNNNTPIFNEPNQAVANEVLGLPIAYANKTVWDKKKATALTGDWDYARYGILEDIEYSISEDATLSTVLGADDQPINLFERDLVALKATMHIAFMTLKDDAFGALTPKVTP